MSQENVEIVRQALVAYSGTGDIPEHLFDPEVEVWESPELPGDLAGKGYSNLVRVNQNLRGSFEEWAITPEEFFDVGDQVLVFVHFGGRGKASGVETDAPMAYLFALRAGRVREWGLFGDRGKALKAVGLAE